MKTTEIISKREQEVLSYISHGFKTKEIAERLFISHFTVKDHSKNAKKKLSAKNIANMVYLAFQNGLLPITEIES